MCTKPACCLCISNERSWHEWLDLQGRNGKFRRCKHIGETARGKRRRRTKLRPHGKCVPPSIEPVYKTRQAHDLFNFPDSGLEKALSRVHITCGHPKVGRGVKCAVKKVSKD